MIYWVLLTAAVSTIVITCDAHSYNETKTEVLKGIVRKLCNITMGSIRNASLEKKEEAIKKLEMKLKNASKYSENDNENLIKMIMQGIEVMILNNDYTICIENDSAVQVKRRHGNTNITSDNEYVPRANDEGTPKQKLFQEMVHKLEFLANKSFTNATTAEDKTKILDNIKTKVVQALQRRNLTTDTNNNSYSDLIVQGLDFMMLKNNDPRRMTFEFLANVKHTNLRSNPEVTSESFLGLTTEKNCDLEYKKICASLKNLNEFRCYYDATVLSLEKICDGTIDCPDGTDELNCVKQAIKRVHEATEIVKEIDGSRNCYSALVDNSLLTQQGKMLSGVLEIEIDFIKRYTNANPTYDEKAKIVEFNSRSVIEISNEVNMILRTFVIALKGAFCSNPRQELDEIFNRHSYLLDAEFTETVPDLKYSVKTCVCNGKFCANTTCYSACKRICFQKHTLKQLTCNAINGEASVPFDVVCDGKLDCYDESDEMGCVQSNGPSRFEASKIFDDILKMIKTKTSLNDLEPARKKMITLYNAIKAVQKISMKPKIKPFIFRTLRDKCFTLMTEVYQDMIDTISVVNRAEDTYEFLDSLKEKLINALKRSQTGNQVIIPPDGCFCRGFTCSVPRCTKKCTRICAAKPMLTRYSCDGDGVNGTYVPVDFICNGKSNCPGGQDELYCKKEACRAHHLVVLRHQIQKVGEKQAGTVLGEVLKVWKKKVVSSLSVAETRDRPTAHDFKQIVSEIIGDLVNTYASLEDYRRANNKQVLSKFAKLAQRILETLKSCGM